MQDVELGIIGGSGLYGLARLEDREEVVLETPWGAPSGPFRVGRVAGRRVAFLARHGEGHTLLPSEINHRANVWGFRLLGAQRLLSASAVGSLRETMAPLDIVVVDQFIDRATGRPATFFGDGMVAHVSLADPTCPRVRALAVAVARDAAIPVHDGGTYLCIDGPQFSTRAESRLYRSWGADVIGMTNATEARLAREAELCYSSLAMVTDWDSWHESAAEVTVEMLLANLTQVADRASRLLTALVAQLPAERDCPCGRALAAALVTDGARVPARTRERLSLLLGKHRGPGG